MKDKGNLTDFHPIKLHKFTNLKEGTFHDWVKALLGTTVYQTKLTKEAVYFLVRFGHREAHRPLKTQKLLLFFLSYPPELDDKALFLKAPQVLSSRQRKKVGT